MPETAPGRWNPQTFLAPIFVCTRHALEGKNMSGVTVATMIRSSSAASIPLCSSNRLAAAKRLLEQRGIDAAELDLIIVATVTPDMFFPSSACLVQTKIGAKNVWGFHLPGAVSGIA